ncbi:MAG: hypothetical protein HYZ34_05370 [Ignavibacteriae bacterium]|nr:hypothetical protein [Ignavibacteriota bacterium]
MKKVVQYSVILLLLVVYIAAVFCGQYIAVKKVLYSTTYTKCLGTKESESNSLDLRPYWTSKSQITSSAKIHVPSEALLATFEFSTVTEAIFVEHEILLPNNLQPLSFPSKPRDPPVA